MTKRVLIFILAFAMMLPSVLIPTEAFAANAYDLIDALSYDKAGSVAGQGQTLAERDYGVGGVYPQGWILFKKIDFTGKSPLTVEATIGTRAEYAKSFKILIDSPTSDPIAIVDIVDPINFEEGVTYSAPLLRKVTGVHDVYFIPVNSTMALHNFQFVGEKPEVNAYREYTGAPLYADVEDEQFNRDIDLLTQLGLFSLADPELNANMPVTRAEFAQSVYGIFKDIRGGEGVGTDPMYSAKFSDVSVAHSNADAISYLGGRGIMNGTATGVFGAEAFISNIDAVVVLVRALGYQQMADEEGGYPNGYIKIATKKKIITGTLNDDMLRRGDLINLFKNAIETEVMVPTGVVDGYVKYTSIDGILEDTQNVYAGEGVVEGSTFSALALPGSDLGVNTVVINGEEYKTGRTNAIGLLGVECEFYYQEKGGIKTIRAIVPTKDTELIEIASAKDEILSIKNDEIVYIPEGKDEEETIEIDKTARLMYNGVAAEEKLEDMLSYKENFIGKIRVIENGDKSQNIAVEEYQDYIVSTISPDNNSFKAADNRGTISWDANDYVFVQDAAGAESAMKNIKAGDLLTVYESKNTVGKKLIRIRVSDSSIEGTVNKIENGEIYINDVKYEVSNHGTTPKIGQDGIFVLNIYGDIVKIKDKDPSAWRTGLFMDKKITDTGFEKSAEIKIVGADGKVQIYPVANKLTADGIVISDANIQVDGAENSFCGIANIEKEEVIRYRINNDGKLFAIDTYRTGAGNHNDTVLRLHTNYDNPGTATVEKQAFTYMKNNQTLFSNSDKISKFYLLADAAIFTFYGEEHEAESTIVSTVGTKLNSTDLNFWGDIYSTKGEAYEADVLVWKDSVASIATKRNFVYGSKGKGVNEDGDEVDLVYGWQGGVKVTYTIDKSGKVYCQDSVDYILNAQPGDVFNVTVNANNVLIRVVKVVFLNGGALSRDGIGMAPTLNKDVLEVGATADERYMYGKVEEKKDGYLVVKISDSKKEVVALAGSVCIVDKRADDGQYFVEKAKLDNISVGDTVLVSFYSYRTNSIVVYRDIAQ